MAFKPYWLEIMKDAIFHNDTHPIHTAYLFSADLLPAVLQHRWPAKRVQRWSSQLQPGLQICKAIDVGLKIWISRWMVFWKYMYSVFYILFVLYRSY